MNDQTEIVESLGLLLTANCNLNCTYCYQHKQTARSTSWADLKSSLEWAFKHCGDHLQIVMSGGEPLLELGLIHRILDYAVQTAPAGLDLDLRLMTNGLLLTEDTFLALAARNVEIRLSCDGVAAAQARRSSHNPASGDLVLQRLAQADGQAFHDLVVVAMTVLPATVPHLADGIAHLLDQGVGQIEMGPVLTPCPGWDGTDFGDLHREFQRLGETCLDQYERTGEIPLTLLRHRNLPRRPRNSSGPVCNAGRTCSPVMDVDGRWYSCGIFAGSVSCGDQESAAVSADTCWGPPGTAVFQDRVATHNARMVELPAFQEQPARTGLFGPCIACEHYENCRVCPLVLLPNQLHTASPRVPGFVCAFNALADQTRQDFPCLPTTSAVRLQSQVLARQEELFLQRARDLLS